jgi:TonB-dependent SusC/RagA subfamily outer membrane receptor
MIHMKQKQNNAKTLLLTMATIVLAFSTAFSQTKSITGTIKDNNGEPLPGVTVVVQGTNNGVVSDIDGNFTISALPADKLVISFIGMKQQVVSISDKTNLTIIMESDVISLDEVIAVGYSTKKRTEISSSVVNLNSEQLSAATATAMDGIDLLQGKVAGLTIMDNNYDSGQSPSVRIRGTGSINASSEPLWVVDGVIASATAFNPNDVESMTVMKDAGATGLYGSKAAGGVIVVTTKSGKAGFDRFNVNVS